jgi:hypothetical protein
MKKNVFLKGAFFFDIKYISIRKIFFCIKRAFIIKILLIISINKDKFS